MAPKVPPFPVIPAARACRTISLAAAGRAPREHQTPAPDPRETQRTRAPLPGRPLLSRVPATEAAVIGGGGPPNRIRRRRHLTPVSLRSRSRPPVSSGVTGGVAR